MVTIPMLCRGFWPKLRVLVEEPSRRQISPNHRGRSFAQQKRFRMTVLHSVALRNFQNGR
jgi:hypothetical protein